MIITWIWKQIKARKDPAAPKKKTQPTCSHRSESSIDPCPTCKADNRARTKYRWTIILGLFLPFSLQALDVTIIASALPFIAADFRMAFLSLKTLLEIPY
jgi:hypothetical protein